MIRLMLRFLLLFLLFPLPALAAGISCPESVETKQELTASYGKWQPSLARKMPHYLTGYDLYDGPPEQLAQLKPDTADTNSTYTEWTFDPTARQNLFVACTYSGTYYLLIQKLPLEKLSRCRFEYDEINNFPQKLECK